MQGAYLTTHRAPRPSRFHFWPPVPRHTCGMMSARTEVSCAQSERYPAGFPEAGEEPALQAPLLSAAASSYARIAGANDRVGVGIVGFSDRFRNSLAPSFLQNPRANLILTLWRYPKSAGTAGGKKAPHSSRS